MKMIVYTASPNVDGLTAACGKAAAAGIRDAGGVADIVNLNQYTVGVCQACDRGYGTCWGQHTCQVQDDFQALHQQLLEADGYIIVSPVYWGEMSESAKTFFDRVRRCEATRWEHSLLGGKLAAGVAAAGGSGKGTITCLFAMQQLFNHVHSEIFDLISITKKSREYQLDAIRRCGEAMVRAKADIS
jgi:multimeric flavodoxin WrbA